MYVEVVTASDDDAYWVLCNAASVGMWGGYIDASSNRWFNMRCANLRSAQQFMAVGSVDNGSGSNIRGRHISAAIYSIGSEITVSGSESGNKGGPQIGGDPFPAAPAYYCVTYDRDYSPGDNDILTRLMAPNGTLVGPGTIYLSNPGGTVDDTLDDTLDDTVDDTVDDTSSISRSNGGSAWTVAWSRSGGFGLSDVWAARISFNGLILNTPYQLPAGHDDYYVSVSSPLSSSDRTMIVFQRDYGTDHDVHALVQDGLTPFASANLSTMGKGRWFNRDQAEPEVDSDGRHFVVTCAEQHVLGTTRTTTSTSTTSTFPATRWASPRCTCRSPRGRRATAGRALHRSGHRPRRRHALLQADVPQQRGVLHERHIQLLERRADRLGALRAWPRSRSRARATDRTSPALDCVFTRRNRP